jgi:hypothetical protein
MEHGQLLGPSRIAAHDSRCQGALVGAMGVYQQKDTILNTASTALSRKITCTCRTFMMNIAFDEMTAQMTLAPVADRIKCRRWLVMGEF